MYHLPGLDDIPLEFICSVFLHSFKKLSLTTHYVSGIVLGDRDVKMEVYYHQGVHGLVGRPRQINNYKIAKWVM